jgi:hypothetical protein
MRDNETIVKKLVGFDPADALVQNSANGLTQISTPRVGIEIQ